MFKKIFSWYDGPVNLKPDISFYDSFIPQFVPEEKSLNVYEKEEKIIYTTDFFEEAYKVQQNPTYFLL